MSFVSCFSFCGLRGNSKCSWGNLALNTQRALIHYWNAFWEDCKMFCASKICLHMIRDILGKQSTIRVTEKTWTSFLKGCAYHDPEKYVVSSMYSQLEKFVVPQKDRDNKFFFYRINFCVPRKTLSKGIFLRRLPKRLMDGIMFQTLFKATFYLIWFVTWNIK